MDEQRERLRSLFDAVSDTYDQFTMSTGQRGFWQLTPEAERPRVRDEAYRILRGAAAADGSVTFTQRVRYTVARNA